MILSPKELSEYFDIESPATNDDLANMESHFGIIFPKDYKVFLLTTNGLEGSANNEYLVLWGTTELIELNETYRVKDFIQDIILFGSDGAETAFAFDISGPQPCIVQLPFIGMGHIPNEKLADSFEEFLFPRVKHL